jgi:hypothetical protein
VSGHNITFNCSAMATGYVGIGWGAKDADPHVNATMVVVW